MIFFIRAIYVTRLDARVSLFGRSGSLFKLRISNAPRNGNVRSSERSLIIKDGAPATERSIELIISSEAACKIR